MRFLLFCLLIFTITYQQVANATLCESVQDGTVGSYARRDVNIYQELFPDTTHRGNRKWNEIVAECNRTRDSKGKEILRALLEDDRHDLKNTLKRPDLDYKVIRGKYKYMGTGADIGVEVVMNLKYVYLLGKTNGVWEMIIPYKAELNDKEKNRVDFYVGYKYFDDTTERFGALNKEDSREERYHAWQLYDSSQVMANSRQSSNPATYTLADVANAQPITETLCATSTYYPGKANKYAGQSGVNASKRDKWNKHISLGRIEYYNKKEQRLYIGCRVKKDEDLYWRPGVASNKVIRVKPFNWVRDNFVRVTEKFWSIDNVFNLKILIKGYNGRRIPLEIRNLLEENDHLATNFATYFRGREMYKADQPFVINNFSTMTEDQTLIHEVGHAFGLDDEYGGRDKNSKPKENHCENKLYKKFDTTEYVMCDQEAPETRSMYHYLAASRYGTKQKECSEDGDCPDSQYCDKKVGKNQCVPKKLDGLGCTRFTQCKGGGCNVRCYTPDSKQLNQSCNLDSECAKGTCSAAGFGVTPGKCVCTTDDHCDDGEYCNKGVADIGTNVCRAKQADGALCTKAHQCSGGSCNVRCYTANSKNMGQSCNISDECAKGKCSGTGWGAIPGKCVCDSNNDCSSNKYCYKGVGGIGTNVCKKKLDLGKACTKGHQCKSNCCRIYFGVPQCRPSGKCD